LIKKNDILLGRKTETVLTLTYYYIYVMQSKKVIPTFQLYIRYLKPKALIENKQIAIKQAKLHNHDNNMENIIIFYLIKIKT